MSEPASGPALLPGRDFRVVASPRHHLEFPLPDGPGWKVDDESSSWLVATHGRSESSLSLKTWRADGVVNRKDCERAARQSRPELPEFDGSSLAERLVRRPPGFDTAMTFSVQPDSDDALRGLLVAFGANVRRCLAVVFSTRARGPDAERILGDRLGLVDHAVLDQLREWSVEDRARQSPLR